MMISPQSVIPAQPASAAPPKPATSPAPVTQAELDWAVQLEKAVTNGYQPNTQEQEMYTEIYKRYQSSQAEASAQTEKASPSVESGEKAESSKGILDYPKDLAMGITEYAAKGQAKNSIEFLDDAGDIKENLGDSWDHIKKGEVGKAGIDVLKAVGNTASAGVNLFQTGLHTLLGGFSTVVSLPLNLLDKGAEKAGEHLSKSESGFGKAVGKVSTFIGGQNSNVGYNEALQTAAREGVRAAHQD
ncbi:hypothetical protein COW36_20905 [bacterium (Candidatus Blackallbacteria) CG17_big_fil_post_rev_8_21_14_2_50_48_46]|uniref:Uncharacterized protein n=1 Tax=bacterium (Candidatus Blackallbacteria) CG17_big_fil_post_rev_8_21_14_2_50_48_46 TaxID=2014261 RepID=A0A2M7FZ03_9BACT|nr:MAG: hypothetical protein COW64_14215 [bacterium (Candidatus Blackallbacteria) CG18_big_fil_WC_8_21_14_2_50_49_26]PIW14502.1 MAG: hypothetical protein COW36_20905 [bacterium (Candidatus Blackallbacteria) CG17_big_fil_post_rev_8_21_14_2_50_48_46]PIW47187.1 MAG: hypothetical protein COW20_13350 [bacterium (Candidatus Blackallbacteria) CG13_big_fil_rev_8_21_14_2_50_49_14]